VSAALPPFSGDEPRCIKCGNEGAITEWKAPEKLGGTVLREEWLRRRCSRCGFGWDEATVPVEQVATDE
jgi:ribosomal protein S27AE